MGVTLSQLSYSWLIWNGAQIFSKASTTLGLKSMDLAIASSIFFSIFDLKIGRLELIKKVTGIFFPNSDMVGLSFHSID